MNTHAIAGLGSEAGDRDREVGIEAGPTLTTGVDQGQDFDGLAWQRLTWRDRACDSRTGDGGRKCRGRAYDKCDDAKLEKYRKPRARCQNMLHQKTIRGMSKNKRYIQLKMSIDAVYVCKQVFKEYWFNVKAPGTPPTAAARSLPHYFRIQKGKGDGGIIRKR